MRTNLWGDPRVGTLCELCDASEATIIGGLFWLWSTADTHSENGEIKGCTMSLLDRRTGIPNFAESLQKVGWLYVENTNDNDLTKQKISVPRFEEHNGKSCKKRLADAHYRAVVRSNFDKKRTKSDNLRHSYDQEQDQDQDQEYSTSPIGDVSAQAEKVQFKGVVDAYHELCPSFPKIQELTDSRKNVIRARWKSGKRMDDFRELFAKAEASDFLSGRKPSDRHTVFNLDWLLKAANWIKVLEGNYNNDRAKLRSVHSEPKPKPNPNGTRSDDGFDCSLYALPEDRA